MSASGQSTPLATVFSSVFPKEVQKMEDVIITRGLSCFHRLWTGSLPAVALLLVVQVLLGSRFVCPSYSRTATIVHSILYFLVPVASLFILGWALRTRRPPGGLCTKSYSCRHRLYVVGRAGKLPLIWVLLWMTDIQYFMCLDHPNWYIDNKDSVHVSVQIGGLAGLALLLILDYAVPQASCAQNCYCIQYWNEDLVLEEVEVVLQQKVEEKRKAFLEDIIQSDLDQLTPQELYQGVIVSDLVWKYKDIVLKKCAEICEGNLERNELNNPN